MTKLFNVLAVLFVVWITLVAYEGTFNRQRNAL